MKYTEALQMRKTADGGVINDALGNAITVGATLPLGGIGGLASLGGTIAGLAAGPAKEKDLNKMDKRPAYSYIPGVGAYRLARKQLAAVDNSRPRSTLLSEMAGPLTSSVAPALVGAGLGAAFGGQQGAAIGALAGGAASGGATLLGNLIGMARRRRTDMERGIEDEEESRLANLLVPGVAGYRTGRRALDAYDDEVKRNEWNEEARQYAGRELVADMLRAQGNPVYTFGGPGNDGLVLSYRPSSAPAPAEANATGDGGTAESAEAPTADTGKQNDKEQKKEASLRMYTAALQMRKQADEAGKQWQMPFRGWTPEDTAHALHSIDEAPGPDEVRTRLMELQEGISDARPVFDALKNKYAPLIDEAKAVVNDKARALNWANTHANAIGAGVGGVTAAGTHWLTGKMPWIKNHPTARLLASLLSGGIAGTYAAGGIKDRAINKAIIG